MDTTNNTLNITLKLGTRVMPMTIKREDEYVYREAEKLINGRFAFYADKYPNQGSEMYLTMMALEIALRLKKMEQNTDPEPLVSAISALVAEVEETLINK